MPSPFNADSRRALRRSLRATGLALLVFVLSAGAYFGSLQLDGNIRVVEPGRLVRSAQLSRAQFTRVIRRDGIRSIINLRGAHPGAKWYDAELAVADSLGVKHFDVGMSAEHFVSAAQIDSILQLLRTAPAPVLIHCQGGADRSGLVAALYEAEIVGRAPDVADRQLALKYGHFPYLFSHTDAMDRSFWAYVNAHSPAAAAPARASAATRDR
ncbi:MAG: tyrosine-protein phosphatase [Gemmatimonadota bacterium]|nr:tyrosine-protein phosphatase [Gemmatimonadota bacterium]